MKNSIYLILALIVITSTTSKAQSWTTSGDTVSTTGTIKGSSLNITGSCVKFPGILTDTNTDLLGINKLGKVSPLIGPTLSAAIYPTVPPFILTCDTTNPLWYKQSIFGNSALVTRYCTVVGVGEAGISNFPDAPLSISNSSWNIQFSVVNPTTLQDVVTINKNGNGYFAGSVAIGDSVTTPGSYGLYVRKGILTSIVKIALPSSGSWSDYVFGNNYKLKSLLEVEHYIKENKHLPGVPSADSVQKNGINVGEMDALMMKKIEELTLYIIQQDKKIQQLQDKVDALSSGNKK